jgi:epsilon-lactone hydrolase
MVMGARPEVKTASRPMTVFALTGLAAQLLNALASVPFRRPWKGPESRLHNVGITVTRTVMRAFLGHAGSLPTNEFRSLERILDGLCRVALPPFLRQVDVAMREATIAGIGGWSYERRSGEPRGTILYLHGGGYIGTSPVMYTIFTGRIAAETGCRVFVPDYRLAPEFPFPSSLVDAIAVYRGLLDAGVHPERLFVAGDSGGGGLVNALLLDPRTRSLPKPAGVLLFSPEVSLTLDEPSITENAGRDILPWNIPVWPYLRGLDARDPSVSAIGADLHDFPPVFVCFGKDEMFRDAIRRFVGRLEAAGIATTAIEEPDMFHAFPLLVPWADASARVFRAVGEFVTRQLEQAHGSAESRQVLSRRVSALKM